MPTLVPSEYRSRSRKKRNFSALYAAIVLLSLHWVIVAYLNSTFLEQYVSGAAIGVLYTASSAVTVLIFLFISRVLRKAGNYHLTLFLTLIEFATLIGMASAESLRVAIPLFMVHQAIVPLILFNLDIYMEKMIGKNESSTGGRRGLYLALMSLAGATGPLLSGFLVGNGGNPNYAAAYLGAAIVLLPFIYVIVRHFKTFEDPPYREIRVLDAIRGFWDRADIRNVFFAHFLLQLFFVWTVIYMPLYLTSVIGYDWPTVGLILFVGLLAYVFLEYPVGLIADRFIGEKEMMALGFVIIAVSTSWFVFMSDSSIIGWMVIMFMTRVGASLVEVTTESYFFKHTKGSEPNIISFFRITRPLSFVVGALLGSLMLLYLPFNLLFVVIGLLMIPGLFFTMALKDTR